MQNKINWKIGISCLCFLSFIYLLSLFYPTQNQTTDMQTMAMEEKEKSTEKIMYLTFDDGPSKNTQGVLDILAKHNIKATFFVTGSQPEYYSMIKEIHKQGHAIGLHTFSHDYKQIYQSVDAYFKDLDQIKQLVFEQSGINSTILRFPGGSSNTVSKKYCNKIMSELVKEVEKRGYSYYDWNAHNGDGNSHLSASTLLSKAINDVKGKNHVMMLMHDGTGNIETLQSLDETLTQFIEQGYVFKVIDPSKKMPIFHHHIHN